VPASVLAPDAIQSLRESFSLHLDASRSPRTTRLYLIALDNLIRHLEAVSIAHHADLIERAPMEHNP
jgi:hypothetical protein